MTIQAPPKSASPQTKHNVCIKFSTLKQSHFTVFIYSKMEAEITILRSRGRRLDTRERSQCPVIKGDLVMQYKLENSHRPSFKVLEMRVGHPDMPGVAAMLFDPELVHVTPDGIVLRGMERLSGGSVVLQEWHCKLCKSSSNPERINRLKI